MSASTIKANGNGVRANGIDHQLNGRSNGHVISPETGPSKATSGISTAPPTHPGLVEVHWSSTADQFGGEKTYDTYATSLVDLPSGAVFSPIKGWTPASKPTYATVQTGEHSHLNLNSDLLYINHSCQPSLEFHMDDGNYHVRVSRDRPLKSGDLLSFFYPSTEWDMAQQFACKCGEAACVGTIGGAKEFVTSGKRDQLLSQWYVNDHIKLAASSH